MSRSSQPRVAVCAVTRDALADLSPWWNCLQAQECDFPIEVSIVDSGSADGTVEALQELPRVHSLALHLSRENLGFAEGMNRAIAATTAPWVLALNVDTRPQKSFVAQLVARGEMRSPWRIGAVTARLERFAEPGVPTVLDACGMRLVPSWRHLDRGSNRVDDGQYPLCERVFGGTGAATLYRRAALQDAAIGGPGGPTFDPLFHSFREDAELCFRLRERGWEIVFEPAAIAAHRRSNLPTRRRQMPAMVNFHSLKNRYLLRAYHQTWATRLLTTIPTLWRDALALLYVLLFERSSLAAYAWLWKNRRAIRERARAIRGRRTAPAWNVAMWFVDEDRPI